MKPPRGWGYRSRLSPGWQRKGEDRLTAAVGTFAAESGIGQLIYRHGWSLAGRNRSDRDAHAIAGVPRGRTEFITEEFTTMGLSAEVCESFVKDCINVKQLQRLAAAIDARLVALDAKSKAKADKRAKASK